MKTRDYPTLHLDTN